MNNWKKYKLIWTDEIVEAMPIKYALEYLQKYEKEKGVKPKISAYEGDENLSNEDFMKMFLLNEKDGFFTIVNNPTFISQFKEIGTN
jgi:hypothetical protein